jgi:pre-rRNA-processing protein TSR3
MRPFIVAIRHPREKRSKCSLTPVEALSGTLFRRANPGFSYDGTGHILLAPGAPEISPEDAFATSEELAAFVASGRRHLALAAPDGRPLRPVLLLDSVWRLLPGVRAKIVGNPVERSLPAWVRTAYPRSSKMTEDPECGLATVEALYAALRLMGMDCPELLDGYLWKEAFLEVFDAGLRDESMRRSVP